MSKIAIPSYLVAYLSVPEKRFYTAGPIIVDPSIVKEIADRVLFQSTKRWSYFREEPYYSDAYLELVSKNSSPRVKVCPGEERLMDLAEAFVYYANRKQSTHAFFEHLYYDQMQKCAKSVKKIDFVIPEQDWRGLGISKRADEMQSEHTEALAGALAVARSTKAAAESAAHETVEANYKTACERVEDMSVAQGKPHNIANYIMHVRRDPRCKIAFERIFAELMQNGLTRRQINTDHYIKHIRRQFGEKGIDIESVLAHYDSLNA